MKLFQLMQLVHFSFNLWAIDFSRCTVETRSCIYAPSFDEFLGLNHTFTRSNRGLIALSENNILKMEIALAMVDANNFQ